MLVWAPEHLLAPSPLLSGSVLGINNPKETLASLLGDDPAFRKRVREGGAGCEQMLDAKGVKGIN